MSFSCVFFIFVSVDSIEKFVVVSGIFLYLLIFNCKSLFSQILVFCANREMSNLFLTKLVGIYIYILNTSFWILMKF